VQEQLTLYNVAGCATWGCSLEAKNSVGDRCGDCGYKNLYSPVLNEIQSEILMNQQYKAS
jgi:hypothetical protein